VLVVTAALAATHHLAIDQAAPQLTWFTAFATNG